jgi:hypothetical protein
VRYSFSGMAYGVHVAETRLEQNLMRLTCVLSYYRLHQDHSTNNWDSKKIWANRNNWTIQVRRIWWPIWLSWKTQRGRSIFLGSIVTAYFIIAYSTVIDLPLTSCPPGAFLGRFIRNIPLLSDLAVTSDERISAGTGIAQ